MGSRLRLYKLGSYMYMYGLESWARAYTFTSCIHKVYLELVVEASEMSVGSGSHKVQGSNVFFGK